MKKMLITFLLLLVLSLTGFSQDLVVPWFMVLDKLMIDAGKVIIGNQEYVLPSADGQANQILYTDGSGTLGWIDNAGSGVSWYGVSWAAGYNADSYTRLGTLADSAASADIPDALLPIQASMKRCVVDNAGNVLYYLDSANSDKKATGETISLDGTNGQVMVEIPKFYYYYHYDAADSVFTWKISQDSLAGYVAHPAFFKDSVWVDYRYIGAYEASMWDNSASAMCDSALIPSNIADTVNDTLCSIACGDSIYAKTNEQRTEYRAMAANRGAGWRLMTYYDQSMIQLLYLIEYANFNSQAKIGNGRTALSGLSWVANGYIGKCGMSDVVGNFTGDVSPGDSSTSYMSYRGIENWYGGVWCVLDGIVWDASANDEVTPIPVWVSNHVDYFQDNSSTGMILLKHITNLGATDEDYQYYLENISSGFLPSAVGGSSSTRQGDYYWQYPDNGVGWRLVTASGGATYGVAVGAFALYVYFGVAYAVASYGARVCF